MEVLIKWAGVASLVLFSFWVGYNVYQNWRNRKEKINKDSANEQESEFELVRDDIKKLKDRLMVVEMLLTVPQKPETHYSPSKGITIISKQEKDL
ncbi:MAG: hypothetical protein OXN90_20355 [Gemmatimonadota bacterium]|nr:hypothetical protein [Gemmatimonadota bacterium]